MGIRDDAANWAKSLSVFRPLAQVMLNYNEALLRVGLIVLAAVLFAPDRWRRLALTSIGWIRQHSGAKSVVAAVPQRAAPSIADVRPKPVGASVAIVGPSSATHRQPKLRRTRMDDIRDFMRRMPEIKDEARRLIPQAVQFVQDLNQPYESHDPADNNDTPPRSSGMTTAKPGSEQDASINESTRPGPFLSLRVEGTDWATRAGHLKVTNTGRTNTFAAKARILSVEGGQTIRPIPEEYYSLAWSLNRASVATIRQGEYALITIATIEDHAHTGSMIGDNISLVSEGDERVLEVFGASLNGPPTTITMDIVITGDNMTPRDEPERGLYAVEGKWTGGIQRHGQIRVRKQ